MFVAEAHDQEALMPKHQSHSSPGFDRASGFRLARIGAAPVGRSPPVCRVKSDCRPWSSWVRRWTANLVASGVGSSPMFAADQIGKLEAPGLRPTTDIGDLLDCELVISMICAGSPRRDRRGRSLAAEHDRHKRSSRQTC